jgi:quercetin dioxygenase-like cupin family protein
MLTDYITKSNSAEWVPLVEANVNTKGIFCKTLHFDNLTNRATTFLLKFEPGARYPYHNHPAGEEIYVLEGSCIIEGETLNQGDYLYTPSNFKHAVRTDTGCVLFFVVPEEVVILENNESIKTY